MSPPKVMQTTFGCQWALKKLIDFFTELVLLEVSVRQINLQKCRAGMVELGQKEGDHILLNTEPYSIKSRVSLLNNTLGHSWSTRSVS